MRWLVLTQREDMGPEADPSPLPPCRTAPHRPRAPPTPPRAPPPFLVPLLLLILVLLLLGVLSFVLI
jgi:hypothetical protein